MSSTVPKYPRRVLHVVGGLHVGGAETWLVSVREAMAGAGWEADFCLLDDNEGPVAEEFRSLGLAVEHCSLRPLWSFPMRMCRMMRRGHYDVVHSHVLLFSGAVAAIAKWAGVPVRIAHAHNSSDGQLGGAGREIYRRVMRTVLRLLATHGLACSDDAAEFLGRSARWLPYGANLVGFRKPVVLVRRSDLGIPTDALVLGHVGSLTRQKNQEFLLRAFAEAAMREPRLNLVIAGEGPLRAELEALCESLAIADRVNFMGRRSDVVELMSGLFDGFVMPSLHEGLPVALLEAQAAGLPCLVSDRIGPQVIALADKVEQLPINGAESMWAKAMVQLADRGRLSRRDAVRQLRRAGFDSAASGVQLVAFYEEAETEVR